MVRLHACVMVRLRACVCFGLEGVYHRHDGDAGVQQGDPPSAAMCSPCTVFTMYSVHHLQCSPFTVSQPPVLLRAA
jgi:hypothetical protein